jgi:HTH-type transcriptional repressor of puuD
MSEHEQAASWPPMVLRPGQLGRVDRGSGVTTIPYIGRWNAEANTLTTGITVFAPGTALPLHTHNVEESVLVLEGEAVAVIGDDRFHLVAGDATWVPKDLPHYFANRGQGRMRIYWVYGGRHVTRTICATGQTVEHLSEEDRGAARAVRSAGTLPRPTALPSSGGRGADRVRETP